MVALKSLWSRCDDLFTQIVTVAHCVPVFHSLLLPPALLLSLLPVHSLFTHTQLLLLCC